ncbi:iron ABC transporter permease [Streptomyces ficellus]|uniref:Ferric hydroxamate ABC transporter permease component n=1 Tax=Streptomyces ficellus TaxID=1977088 RepID=A0A1W5T2I2_9ACTN|nr:iron ABC transporter permease [Streptomyces ficellus]ARF06235.1 ferric hydroxamate ABC transporter permease component [Streptomyces ficellus]QGV77884.1 iron ABC transporter permease [Streptomyces ficellus]
MAPDGLTTAAPAARLLGRRPRAVLVGGALSLALCLVGTVHLGLGASGVGIGDIARLLLGNGDPRTADVLLGSRLPRTLTGLVVGVALGVSGVLVQGATRNPLAAPDTLGVNAGAYFAVVLVAFTGVSLGPVPAGGAAFLGGLVAVAVVYVLSGSGVMTPGRVLLAGATVALAGTAGAEFLQMLDVQATRGLFFWGNGTLMQSGLERPLTLGAVVVAGALVAPLLARPLDLLSLGDETAEAMGVRVERVRPAAFLVAVLLSAAAVSLAGPIGFVGLIAPVIVRQLGIRTHAAMIPMAALLASALVLGADAAAQAIVSPSATQPAEIPVGVVTALIGGPVFMALARRVSTGDADTGAAVVVSDRRRAPAYTVALGAGLVALAAAIAVSLRVGDVEISWSQLGAALFGSAEQITEAVVDYRLPRVLVAALAGACLAVAGAAVQAVVRNPLAEPGLVGVTGGASLGAVAVILVVPSAPLVALPAAAGIGGVLMLALVVLVARGSRKDGRAGLDPTRVVLVGLGAAATSMALVNIMVVGAQMNISSALGWLAGSTYARDYSALVWLALPALVAVVLVVAARPVNLLSLGDELPRALGLELGRARLLVLGAGAVLAAGTAAAVGAVGFVGLVAPHLARRLVGNNTARMVPMAAVLGAVLVVSSDALGRWLLAPTEIPVGIVTALVGAPYLVWLLRRL